MIANYADEQKCIALKNVRRSDVIGFIGCILSTVLVGGYVEFGSNICLLLISICRDAYLILTGSFF